MLLEVFMMQYTLAIITPNTRRKLRITSSDSLSQLEKQSRQLPRGLRPHIVRNADLHVLVGFGTWVKPVTALAYLAPQRLLGTKEGCEKLNEMFETFAEAI